MLSAGCDGRPRWGVCMGRLAKQAGWTCALLDLNAVSWPQSQACSVKCHVNTLCLNGAGGIELAEPPLIQLGLMSSRRELSRPCAISQRLALSDGQGCCIYFQPQPSASSWGRSGDMPHQQNLSHGGGGGGHPKSMRSSTKPYLPLRTKLT